MFDLGLLSKPAVQPRLKLRPASKFWGWRCWSWISRRPGLTVLSTGFWPCDWDGRKVVYLQSWVCDSGMAHIISFGRWSRRNRIQSLGSEIGKKKPVPRAITEGGLLLRVGYYWGSILQWLYRNQVEHSLKLSSRHTGKGSICPAAPVSIGHRLPYI